MPLRDSLRRLVARVGPISRRYFVSNGFDGTLTSIGLILGATLSGVTDGFTVVKIGLGAAVGLSTSGVWSVWEIERAEKLIEIHDLERAMLVDLDDTRIEHASQRARVGNAVMSGLGPLVGILIPISPFLVAGTALSIREATVVAVALGVAILFAFGAYMGSLSEQNWVVAGVRMGLAGLVVAAINVLLPGAGP
ncbi:MAG: VIT1/CCC1 transporter family protein [Haloarculaceae archaeon]